MNSKALAENKERKAAGTSKKNTGASKARLRLWLRILKAPRMIERELRERFRTEFNSTLPRFDVMAALHRAESGLKMSELSGVLRVSNGNVTGIVDRLVDEGMIMRVPVHGDRRAMLVRLTRKGRESFSALAETHEGWVNELLGSISASEADQLIELLGSIGKRLEESREAGGWRA